MSIVIIGGHERLSSQYKALSKCHGCKAKVFCKLNGSISKKIGLPDLIILFTDTVSHQMVLSATREAKRNNIAVARIHSSSLTSFKKVLDCHCSQKCLENDCIHTAH